jgi:D-glycero-alpha-D-manno-heptose 1-phosphate guanylyltransferase
MIQKQQITAVILAGGLGTRLRSVVADKSKVMALVNGRPFLEYILDQIVDNGIHRIVVCTGYKGEHIQACFGHSYRHVELLYSHEKEPRGTGGALRLAATYLCSKPTLLLNGDSFCRFDLNNFVQFHISKNARLSIGMVQCRLMIQEK